MTATKAPPSQRKLRMLRKKGEVPKPRFLSGLVQGVVGIISMLVMGYAVFVVAKILLLYRGELVISEVLHLFKFSLLVSVAITLVTSSLIVLGALMVALFQSSLALPDQLLRFNPERILSAGSILALFKKGSLEVLSALLRLIVVCPPFFAFLISFSLSSYLYLLFFLQPRQGIENLNSYVFASAIVLTLVLIVVAVVDLIVVRLFFERKHGMSFDEIRREHREVEGDPHMRSHRGAKRRELYESDLVAAVRRSKVIVASRESGRPSARAV